MCTDKMVLFPISSYIRLIEYMRNSPLLPFLPVASKMPEGTLTILFPQGGDSGGLHASKTVTDFSGDAWKSDSSGRKQNTGICFFFSKLKYNTSQKIEYYLPKIPF